MSQADFDAAVKRADACGDEMQKLAGRQDLIDQAKVLTKPQSDALNNVISCGDPSERWKIGLYQSRFVGTNMHAAHSQEVDNSENCVGVTYSGKGVDYRGGFDGRSYELLSGSRSNIMDHATRNGIYDRFIRYITCSTKVNK
mgnify:FL=1